MTPEEKEAALAGAKHTADEAKKSLETAQAELKAAEEAKDEAKIASAKGKVSAAQTALEAANAEVKAIEEGSGDDIDSMIDGKKLRDGTDPNKEVKLPFLKFQELNEQAKLFEQFAPLLAKIKQDPKLVEQLMKGDDPTKTLDQRMAALEKGQQDAKRNEVKGVITDAVKVWGSEFRSRWDQIKPIVAGLEAQGIPYANAVEQAYFAVNPTAITEGKRLVDEAVARDVENRRGSSSPHGGGGSGPIIHNEPKGKYTLTEADREFALKAGIDPALYEKHADWVERFADL